MLPSGLEPTLDYHSNTFQVGLRLTVWVTAGYRLRNQTRNLGLFLQIYYIIPSCELSLGSLTVISHF